MAFLSIKNESKDIYVACSLKGYVLVGVWVGWAQEKFTCTMIMITPGIELQLFWKSCFVNEKTIF